MWQQKRKSNAAASTPEMRLLKFARRFAKAFAKRLKRILAAVVEGEQVFTHHLVEVEKRHGADAQVEVFAHFTLAAGNIVRCEELTRLINGDESDKALGQMRRTASR